MESVQRQAKRMILELTHLNYPQRPKSFTYRRHIADMPWTLKVKKGYDIDEQVKLYFPFPLQNIAWLCTDDNLEKGMQRDSMFHIQPENR